MNKTIDTIDKDTIKKLNLHLGEAMDTGYAKLHFNEISNLIDLYKKQEDEIGRLKRRFGNIKAEAIKECLGKKDEQIIKALECCGNNVLYENCEDCPYEKDFGKDHICTIKVAKDSLDLIKRQQAKIEDYKLNIKQLTETFTGGNGIRIRVDNMIVYADDLEEWLEFCDKQKEEAIKELVGKYEKVLLSMLTTATLEKKEVIYSCLDTLDTLELDALEEMG